LYAFSDSIPLVPFHHYVYYFLVVQNHDLDGGWEYQLKVGGHDIVSCCGLYCNVFILQQQNIAMYCVFLFEIHKPLPWFQRGGGGGGGGAANASSSSFVCLDDLRATSSAYKQHGRRLAGALAVRRRCWLRRAVYMGRPGVCECACVF
jgi:hypothetical protein